MYYAKTKHLFLAKVFTGLFLIGITILTNAQTNTKAPAYFTAKFETTKGTFEIESRREWSPVGVDRLYELIESGYFADMAIYRVIPDYGAQFGIHNDSTVNNKWLDIKIEDEPVLKLNTKGTITYARGGPKTRGTVLFINLANNSPRLDTMAYAGVSGFPVIAQIKSGFEVADSFYKGYGRALDFKQDSIYLYGNAFLKKHYPELDYIHKAYITGRK